MPDELLPPDPSMRAWYFLRRGTLLYAFEFLPRPDKYKSDWWHRNAPWPDRKETPEHMYREGYRLASPHPIPGPEQLEELYRDAATTAAFRAALGAKPDDPPGESI